MGIRLQVFNNLSVSELVDTIRPWEWQMFRSHRESSFCFIFGPFGLLQRRKKTFSTLIPKVRIQIFNIHQSANFKLCLPKFQDEDWIKYFKITLKCICTAWYPFIFSSKKKKKTPTLLLEYLVFGDYNKQTWLAQP